MMEGQKNIVIRVLLATFTIFLLSELVDTHASKPSMIISNYLKQIRKRKFQLSGRSSWLSKTRYQDPCPTEQKTMNTAHYLGLSASEYYICPEIVTVVSCRRSSLKLNHRGKYYLLVVYISPRETVLMSPLQYTTQS